MIKGTGEWFKYLKDERICHLDLSNHRGSHFKVKARFRASESSENFILEQVPPPQGWPGTAGSSGSCEETHLHQMDVVRVGARPTCHLGRSQHPCRARLPGAPGLCVSAELP